MSKLSRSVVAIFFLVALFHLSTANAQIPPGLRAGLRASNYGITPFPSPTWWVNSINSMSAFSTEGLCSISLRVTLT